MAHPLVFENARRLRKTMTRAEMLMWEYLKMHFPGIKFRRQHPTGLFILDFYCHKFKLAIEIDGEIHDDPEVRERDQMKEDFLKEKDIHLIRFKNLEVSHRPEEVILQLQKLIRDIELRTPH